MIDYSTRSSHRASLIENLENASIIWLDAAVNNAENLQAQSSLRSIINYLKPTESARDCENFLRSQKQNDRVILITSGGLGREIVPRVVNLPQLISIYIYCFDTNTNKGWAKQYNKIQLVTDNLDEIISKIRSDQTTPERRQEESFAFSISDRSTGAIDGTFLHWQVLIDVLLRMKPSGKEIDEFYCLVAPIYSGNDKDLNVLKEFQKTYQPDKVAWWYSRDSCIYRILNKALRTQDPRILFTMRFFIRDLRQQLQEHQCQTPIRVYRGQLMAKDEMKILQKSKDKWISMQSFLSTSTDQKIATDFHGDSKNLERVLFEIDARPELVTHKPFANIHDLSFFQHEDEILFMLGSIFQINNIQQERDGLWKIQLRQCSDADHELKYLYEHMNKEICQGEITLLSYGDVLRRMGRFDDAEYFCQRYLSELPPNHPGIAEYYACFGQVAQDKGHYSESLDSFHKALALFERAHNQSSVADTCANVAFVHYYKDEYKQAIEAFDRALTIYKQLYGDNHRKVAICYDGMGAVYGKMGAYSDALHFKSNALFIWEKQLPANHADLGQSHTCIGNTHTCLGQFEHAMSHFNHSLAIYQRSLPPEHPRVAMTIKNMGVALEKMGDPKAALAYYNKSAAIYRNLLPSDHADVLEIEAKIKNVSQ